MDNISLAQQNGGPNIPEFLNQTVLEFRRILVEHLNKIYCDPAREIAIVIRVDGSITKFGFTGVEKPKLRRDYIEVNIGIPETEWSMGSTNFRKLLLEYISDALNEVIQKCKENKISINESSLKNDFAKVVERFTTN